MSVRPEEYTMHDAAGWDPEISGNTEENSLTLMVQGVSDGVILLLLRTNRHETLYDFTVFVDYGDKKKSKNRGGTNVKQTHRTATCLIYSTRVRESRKESVLLLVRACANNYKAMIRILPK